MEETLIFFVIILSVVATMDTKLSRVRAELRSLHQNPYKLHFNAAGASPMPDPVLGVMQEALLKEQSLGGYEQHYQDLEKFRGTYASLARLLNANSPDEIALCDSATTAWNRAFYSIRLGKDDAVAFSSIDYAANNVAALHRNARVVSLMPTSSPRKIKPLTPKTLSTR